MKSLQILLPVAFYTISPEISRSKPAPYFLSLVNSVGISFMFFIFVLFIPCLHFEAFQSVLARKKDIKVGLVLNI